MAPRGRPTRLNPDATPTPVTPAPNAPTATTVTEAQLQALINQGVAAAMAEAEASRVRNGYDSNGSVPRPAQAARACSYSEFLKCKPLDFKGTEGVIGLTRWFEKMESVFSISNCPATSQVKFTTCTLQDDALTWWNSHVKTTTLEVAHAMPWAALKKMMTDKYCPRGEIKKIETEIMFPEEVDKIEKYIGGLPDMILGSVKASKSKTMQEVIEFTTELMEDKTHVYAERKAERKRKQNGRTGSHTKGLSLYVPSVMAIMKQVLVHLGHGFALSVEIKGHFKRNCPKLNNNDRGNQAGNNKAPAKVYAVGNAEANPDNVVAERVVSTRIIGMDWLSKYSAVIDCAKKIVRIPSGSEILIVRGDGCRRLKTSSERRDLRNVPIVNDFPDVFPEGFAAVFLRIDMWILNRSSTCSFHSRRRQSRRLPSEPRFLDIMNSKTSKEQEEAIYEDNIGVVKERGVHSVDPAKIGNPGFKDGHLLRHQRNIQSSF
ncbi:hypothetical protein Tco_0749598 [Tanacetum coccineum]|uniref:Retrotransposon gag domain-containing protein n=1 Tax=Tanacetum coccineum TaxID=301880 RepID=A0ABQ4YZQ5_9ASTR